MENKCGRFDDYMAECTCKTIELVVYEDQFGCETPPTRMQVFAEIIENELNEYEETTYNVEAVKNSDSRTLNIDNHQDLLTEDVWLKALEIYFEIHTE
jgi:hypothetical protein